MQASDACLLHQVYGGKPRSSLFEAHGIAKGGGWYGRTGVATLEGLRKWLTKKVVGIWAPPHGGISRP